MREKMLVFGEPAIGDAEIDAVVQTLRSKWIGTGPRVKAFQDAFTRHTGAKHAIAVSSCTAALHLVMIASGVGPGDEVITTPMTFCATANAILHAGATPVFADCDRATGNIRPDAIEAAITPRTRAVIPVHLTGRPCDMAAISAIADRHGLMVFEDCAHAIESKVAGRSCGTFGRAGTFSFYVTKNITSIEGGMVVTDDDDLAERVRVMSLHGLSRDAWKRFSDAGYQHYTVSACGYKYNMTDVQAAVALAQMDRLAPMHARRAELWRRYTDELAGLPLHLPPEPAPGTVHAHHLYTPRLDTDRAGLTRDQLLQALHERKIGSGVHYLSLSKHPLYRDMGLLRGPLPEAEWVSDRTFSIPLSAAMSDADAGDVIAALRGVLG